jgi:thiamine-phosphate pyrophosphorylase
MKLIIISNSSIIENEAQVITKLFEAGLLSLHLRKRKMSRWRMKRLIKQIPKHFHNRIIIHSNHSLAFRFKLKGIHLGSKYKEKKASTILIVWLLKLLRPFIEITMSFHTLGEVYDPKHDFEYNYVFLSPIFNSVTSKFQSGFSEHSLKVALEKTNWNIVARGGINMENIESAYRIGFKGLAFYSALWTADDPIVKFNKIVDKFQELSIPIE